MLTAAALSTAMLPASGVEIAAGDSQAGATPAAAQADDGEQQARGRQPESTVHAHHANYFDRRPRSTPPPDGRHPVGRPALGNGPTIPVMSIPVSIDRLHEETERYGALAYLLSTGGDGRPHAVAAAVSWEGGRIVASGRHAELKRESPLYARLAELQFGAATAALEEAPRAALVH